MGFVERKGTVQDKTKLICFKFTPSGAERAFRDASNEQQSYSIERENEFNCWKITDMNSIPVNRNCLKILNFQLDSIGFFVVVLLQHCSYLFTRMEMKTFVCRANLPIAGIPACYMRQIYLLYVGANRRT